MTRREIRKLEHGLDRLAARLEREIAASGIDEKVAAEKAALKRLLNALRMRMKRRGKGEWEQLQRLRGIPVSKLAEMLQQAIQGGTGSGERVARVIEPSHRAHEEVHGTTRRAVSYRRPSGRPGRGSPTSG